MLAAVKAVSGVLGMRGWAIVALAAALAAGALALERYQAGRAAGAAAERVNVLACQRDKADMIAEHREHLAEQTAKAAEQSAAWQNTYAEAMNAQELERARNRAELARVVAQRDRLRSDLEAVATGGVTVADDSLAACRGRASALGSVLATALRSHAECVAELEDLATGIRTLRAAWPRIGASVAGQLPDHDQAQEQAQQGHPGDLRSAP